ncbi:hypothetical protein FKM82_018188 [Ascaphus truei]
MSHSSLLSVSLCHPAGGGDTQGALSPSVDGNYCLTCGSDKSLKLWNPHKGTLLKTYSGHGYEVLDAAGSCDNSQLCSCGSDKTVILWDVAQGQVIRKFRGHAGVSDSVDGHLRRYDLRMGEMYADYLGSPITCVSFSQDGQCLLASSLDSTLRLCDKNTGEMLGEDTQHHSLPPQGSLALRLPVSEGVVQSLSFHPSEPWLLTASAGGVQVWGVASHGEEEAGGMGEG